MDANASPRHSSQSARGWTGPASGALSRGAAAGGTARPTPGIWKDGGRRSGLGARRRLVHHGAQIASRYPRIVQGSHRGGPRRARGRVRRAPSRVRPSPRAPRGSWARWGQSTAAASPRRCRSATIPRFTPRVRRRRRRGRGSFQGGVPRGRVDRVRRRADAHDDGRGCAQNDGGVC